MEALVSRIVQGNEIHVFKTGPRSLVFTLYGRELSVYSGREKKLSKQMRYSNLCSIMYVSKAERRNCEINFSRTRRDDVQFDSADVTLTDIRHMHMNDVCIFSRITNDDVVTVICTLDNGDALTHEFMHISEHIYAFSIMHVQNIQGVSK